MSAPPPVTINAAAEFRKWWTSAGSKLQRVPLLKACEAATAKLFEEQYLAYVPEAKVDGKGGATRARVRAVTLESNLAGLVEFGEEWYQCIRAKMVRMNLCAHYVKGCMAEPSCGFDEFERALVSGAAGVLPAYHQYYIAYLHTVQDPLVVAALEARPPPAGDQAVHSHYTAVTIDGASGGFATAPFATHFKEALAPVLEAFDAWIAACEAASAALGGQSGAWDAPTRGAYLAFLVQYRRCLGSAGTAAELEDLWTELDRKWMDLRMPIQLVHDIETGYGDPLRVKATPDISLRFLDESYAEANAAIADIQRRLMAYYEGRGTPLAKAGLGALANTLAGIYFIPFKTGASLQFSFSGQSIPNRQAVASEKGVKIYFDAVETQARIEINKVLVREMFHEADGPGGVLSTYPPDAVEQLVWHVAAHEVGHAIYNLRSIQDSFSSPKNESLLEEPRAELTSMFTMRLLHQQGVLGDHETTRSLAQFCMDALRYFDKYDSVALRPYIIFQVYQYKVYARTGFLTLHPHTGKLVLDAAKTRAALDAVADTFLRLLDAMDRRDCPALEAILFEEMAPEDAFLRKVMGLLARAKAQMGAPQLAKRARLGGGERMCACHPTWALPTCGECKP